MKIAFVGKGGSGKTSLSSLFINYLLQQNTKVLAVDSDINQHLANYLPLDKKLFTKPVALGSETDKIAAFIFGNQYRELGEILRTTPPNSKSRLLKPFDKNELFDYFAIDQGNLRFLAVGLPPTEQVGEKCYHFNMGALSLLLNHTLDKKEEYIVVDLTAGIDTLVSGIFISYDLIFVVVEPTIASLQVYKDYQDYLQRLGVTIKMVPVANKILDEQDIKFIEDYLQENILIQFGLSPYLRSLEKGQQPDFSSLEPASQRSLSVLNELVARQEKNWPLFYDNLIKFHIKKASSRPDKEKLLEQIDINFKIQHHLQK